MARRGAWDKQIEYDLLKERFVKYFNIKLSEFIQRPNKFNSKAVVYTATAIVQLVNGMRAGESMLALRKFIEDRQDKFEMFSFKQKTTVKLKDGRTREKKPEEFIRRLVRIPSLVTVNAYHIEKAMLLAFNHPDNYMPLKFLDPHTRKKNYKEYDRYVNRYESWMQYNFRVNTHTLRYAWDNKVEEYIPSAELIAKIQGRSDLNVLLNYIRLSQAEKKFDEIFRFLE